VRQRPSLLLMNVRLQAAEATLELGLSKLKKRCAAAVPWLKQLGAVRVEPGEPHFADQADTDPVTKIRAATAKAMALGRRSGEAAGRKRERAVSVVLTAAWDVATMTAEETLVLVDRLRFEAAPDGGAPEAPAAEAGAAEAAEELPPWATPEERLQAQMHERLREMMTPIQQPPADDEAPQFLFIARLGEEQLEKATAEALVRAREEAERLARPAGLRLGLPSSLHVRFGGIGDGRDVHKLMEQRRCAALLAGSSYELGEHDIVSDDPRAAEFTVHVSVSYSVE
jgi:hypothetical protein